MYINLKNQMLGELIINNNNNNNLFTFKTHNDRTNENNVRIFVFTVHETLIMKSEMNYQKCLRISRHVLCTS